MKQVLQPLPRVTEETDQRVNTGLQLVFGWFQPGLPLDHV